jgi:hypothetical protein
VAVTSVGFVCRSSKRDDFRWPVRSLVNWLIWRRRDELPWRKTHLCRDLATKTPPIHMKSQCMTDDNANLSLAWDRLAGENPLKPDEGNRSDRDRQPGLNQPAMGLVRGWAWIHESGMIVPSPSVIFDQEAPSCKTQQRCSARQAEPRAACG